MLRVESSTPCDGRNAHYEVWLHYLFARRQARFVRLELPGKAARVEELLEDAGQFLEPQALVGLAEVTNGHEKRLKQLGVPATASIVRLCDRTTHRDGEAGESGTGRSEARTRILWTPKDPVRIPILPRTVELDTMGIGSANAANLALGVVHPLVSVPVTSAEQRMFNHLMTASALSVLPSDRVEHNIYGLPHPLEAGGTLEQIYPAA